MNPFATAISSISLILIGASSLLGALVPGASTSTMKTYEEGSEKLTLYTDVPGHDISMMNGYASRAKSDIYEIWVRSAATNNVWVQCFANMTYNRGLEMPPMADFQTATATHAYQKHTSGWTHTYANIEMSENSPVEVEIRKIGNTPLDGELEIVKSAVHPAHKVIAGSHELVNGRVYFKINKPCQLVIDINGQMDDHNAAYPSTVEGGAMPNGSKVHSIALYANPIMAKPVETPENRIVMVNPNASAEATRTTRLIAPDPATYDTLVFAPGIHNIGPNFKVHPGKSYFIPGDAILYGNMGNSGVAENGFRSNGDSINIYGYGTICGVQIPHYQNVTHDDTVTGTPNPQYPEWNAWLGTKDQGVGIQMVNTWDFTINGVTVADPANFNTKIDSQSNRVNDQGLMSWVKLHSWRVNGDGCGGYIKIEDSFFRTSDDSTYVRDWRRRCTFWKDTNANIFRFVNYVSGGIEDCDILYARWRDFRGVGSVFEFASPDGAQPLVLEQNLLIKDIRFHDRLSNPRHLFDMAQAQTYKGLKFENISAYEPKNGNKSSLMGSELAPWYERLVFKNVTYKTSDQDSSDTGTLLTAANFNTYFDTNEFAKYTLFDDPRDLSVNPIADPVRGYITKAPDQATHKETTLVTLAASAKPGFVFVGWSGLNGDDPTTDAATNPATVRMLENRDMTANFGLSDITVPVVIDTPSIGSWTVPAGVYSFTLQAWGGGGAGGSAEHTPGSSSVSVRGGGGTGGSYSTKTLKVRPGQVINYVVGAGGIAPALSTGVTFPSDSNSGDGGSSYASLDGQGLVMAIGGLGGKNKSGSSSSTGGSSRTAPASGNLGDFTHYGGNGGGSSSLGTGGGGGSGGSEGKGENALNYVAGAGGSGSGAAGAAGHNDTLDGLIGGFPGGGGSGAGVRNNSSGNSSIRIGGGGGDGRMIITYNTLESSPFTLWHESAFGASAIDPAIAGDLADPDGDGITNLLEFVFGGDARSHDNNDLSPRLITNNTELEFTYFQHPRSTGLVITPRASSDLVTWHTLVPGNEGVSLTVLIPTPADGIDRITLRAPAPPSGPYFIRLVVTSP